MASAEGGERERARDTPVAKKSYTTTGNTGPPNGVFTTLSAAATTATTTKTGHTGNPYPHTYRPPPRVRARSSSPTARSSVQGQTSYSPRQDYWAPDPQQQTYIYAPNNATVGYIDNICVKFNYGCRRIYSSNADDVPANVLSRHSALGITFACASCVQLRVFQRPPSPWRILASNRCQWVG